MRWDENKHDYFDCIPIKNGRIRRRCKVDDSDSCLHFLGYLTCQVIKKRWGHIYSAHLNHVIGYVWTESKLNYFGLLDLQFWLSACYLDMVSKGCQVCNQISWISWEITFFMHLFSLLSTFLLMFTWAWISFLFSQIVKEANNLLCKMHDKKILQERELLNKKRSSQKFFTIRWERKDIDSCQNLLETALFFSS